MALTIEELKALNKEVRKILDERERTFGELDKIGGAAETATAKKPENPAARQSKLLF